MPLIFVTVFLVEMHIHKGFLFRFEYLFLLMVAIAVRWYMGRKDPCIINSALLCFGIAQVVFLFWWYGRVIEKFNKECCQRYLFLALAFASFSPIMSTCVLSSLSVMAHFDRYLKGKCMYWGSIFSSCCSTANDLILDCISVDTIR